MNRRTAIIRNFILPLSIDDDYRHQRQFKRRLFYAKGAANSVGGARGAGIETDIIDLRELNLPLPQVALRRIIPKTSMS